MKTIESVLGKKGRSGHTTLRPFTKGPDGHVMVSDDGKYYVLIAPSGTRIAFDTCGRCSLHVRICKCADSPTLPRSIEYIWDSEQARSKGEEWNSGHPNYKGSFTARETKRNLRMSIPDFKPSAAPKPRKRLSDYIKRIKRNRMAGVKRLLLGKRK